MRNDVLSPEHNECEYFILKMLYCPMTPLNLYMLGTMEKPWELWPGLGSSAELRGDIGSSGEWHCVLWINTRTVLSCLLLFRWPHQHHARCSGCSLCLDELLRYKCNVLLYRLYYYTVVLLCYYTTILLCYYVTISLCHYILYTIN